MQGVNSGTNEVLSGITPLAPHSTGTAPSQLLGATAGECWKARQSWPATPDFHAYSIFKKNDIHIIIGEGKKINWIKLPSCFENNINLVKALVKCFLTGYLNIWSLNSKWFPWQKAKSVYTLACSEIFRTLPCSNLILLFLCVNLHSYMTWVAKGIQLSTNHLQRIICVENILQPIID